jgi:phosphate transport system substrate-binding protein
VGGPDAVIHIPLVMGAVVPIYNLEGVEELHLSGPVLADIYLEKIKKWNDPAIAVMNKDAKLPDKNILTVHRADGSGTTYIWTDYLSKSSKEFGEKVGNSTKVNFPGGEEAKGSEGVAGKVSQSPGSIGYVEMTYALQNRIKFAAVQNREKKFVLGSPESVTAAAKSALPGIPKDLRYSLTDQPGEDSYPLSGTTWAVIYTEQPAGKGQALKDYLKWATHDGQQYTKDLHYARLPEDLVKLVDAKLDTVKLK